MATRRHTKHASSCSSGLLEAEKIYEQVQGIVEAVRKFWLSVTKSRTVAGLYTGGWDDLGLVNMRAVFMAVLFDTRFLHHQMLIWDDSPS